MGQGKRRRGEREAGRRGEKGRRRRVGGEAGREKTRGRRGLGRSLIEFLYCRATVLWKTFGEVAF